MGDGTGSYAGFEGRDSIRSWLYKIATNVCLTASGPIAALRRRGYRHSTLRHQLGDHVQLIQGGHAEIHGALAAQTVLHAEPLPTAVLTFNDRCAMGFIDTLVRAGVDTPETISVVGYDDSPIARLAHINLTSVSQNTHELIDHAVIALIERLDGSRTEHREVVVQPRLVIRGTTGPPPG